MVNVGYEQLQLQQRRLGREFSRSEEESPEPTPRRPRQGLHQNPLPQSHSGMVEHLERSEVKLLVLSACWSQAAENQVSQIQPGPRENRTPEAEVSAEVVVTKDTKGTQALGSRREEQLLMVLKIS